MLDITSRNLFLCLPSGQRLTVIRRDRSSQHTDPPPPPHPRNPASSSSRTISQSFSQPSSSLQPSSLSGNNEETNQMDDRVTEPSGSALNSNNENPVSISAPSPGPASGSAVSGGPSSFFPRARAFQIRSGVMPSSRAVLLLNRRSDDGE